MWQKIEAIFRRKVEKLDTEKIPAVVNVFDVVDAVDAPVVHGGSGGGGNIIAKDIRLI